MTILLWDAVGSRRFEAGVDRGVLYLSNNVGVPWNGLISFVENPTGEDVTSFYFDGKKHTDFVGSREFAGTLTAYTYPDQFLEYDGISTAANGINLDGQQRKPFGLSYRNQIGNDLVATEHGYKIHVLYDLTAVPSDITHDSFTDSLDAIQFEWNVTARPQTITGHKPTAHVIVDSTKVAPDVLATIESILYGSSGTTARLPTIAELLALTSVGYTIVVTDNGDGTWTATGPDGYITMLDADTFQITGIDATTIDAGTYQISST